MIKFEGSAAIKEIHKLFRKILTTSTIPDQWRTSITVPVFKKGDKQNPSNYRGISLLNGIPKLFTRILSTLITQKIRIAEEQQGFRQNRSAIDGIFLVRQLSEKAIEFDKPLFLCFVDFAQAFDKIRLPDVLATLKNNGLNTRIVKLIEQLNINNRTEVKYRNMTTNEIQVSVGIRQWDSLRPTLFNCLMDEVIKDLKSAKIGYAMGDHTFQVVAYADDVVLMAENEDDLQRLLYRLTIRAEEFNMQISIKHSPW